MCPYNIIEWLNLRKLLSVTIKIKALGVKTSCCPFLRENYPSSGFVGIITEGGGRHPGIPPLAFLKIAKYVY